MVKALTGTHTHKHMYVCWHAYRKLVVKIAILTTNVLIQAQSIDKRRRALQGQEFVQFPKQGDTVGLGQSSYVGLPERVSTIDKETGKGYVCQDVRLLIARGWVTLRHKKRVTTEGKPTRPTFPA
jgi:hypothetical protein